MIWEFVRTAESWILFQKPTELKYVFQQDPQRFIRTRKLDSLLHSMWSGVNPSSYMPVSHFPTQSLWLRQQGTYTSQGTHSASSDNSYWLPFSSKKWEFGTLPPLNKSPFNLSYVPMKAKGWRERKLGRVYLCVLCLCVCVSVSVCIQTCVVLLL